MELKIKAEDAQKILSYLAKQPFDQVHQLVPILLNLAKVDGQAVEAEVVASEEK